MQATINHDGPLHDFHQDGGGSAAADGALPLVREGTCPACGHHLAVACFDGGRQPLATLGWPTTARAARAMRRLPIDFVRCVECGHVYNPAFDYNAVPYKKQPNLMFNRGAIWSDFIRDLVAAMVRCLPLRPTVAEIGYGDGGLLRALAEALPGARLVGFDPHGVNPGGVGVDFRNEFFVPEQHLAELRPDLVISRHVLEHLTNPLAFLQRIGFAAAGLGREQLAYFEVPCIDRALAARRTSDFYYEHSSQFTTQSFVRMLARCGARRLRIGHGYNGEVIYGYAWLGGARWQLANAAAATRFLQAAQRSRGLVKRQFAELAAAAEPVALWGGTGKSAAFINRYELDAARFPLVVDSDPAKSGTCVPGTGQRIRPVAWLRRYPGAVIVIPPQWRAADILQEIEAKCIRFSRILIEHQGRLVDFLAEPHPYRHRPEPVSRPSSGSSRIALGSEVEMPWRAVNPAQK